MDIRICPGCNEKVDIEDSVVLASHIEHRLCNWCNKAFNTHTEKEQLECSIKHLCSLGHDVAIVNEYNEKIRLVDNVN